MKLRMSIHSPKTTLRTIQTYVQAPKGRNVHVLELPFMEGKDR